MDKIRLGLIGLGAVANAHLAAIRQLETVQLVFVCDIREAHAQRVASDFSGRPYTDYRDLLDADGIDLAVILTPASTHRVIVEAAAASGAHVFFETPLAVTVRTGCRH